MKLNGLYFSCLLAFASYSVLSTSASAASYVGVQDKQLHYDLQTMVEWGYMEGAVNTYPVPWKGVAQQLEKVDVEQLSGRPLQAFLRLSHYLSLKKSKNTRRFLTLQGASDDVRFRSLDDGVEDTGKLSISSEFYFGRWSGQVSANYSTGGKKTFDNTFIAYQFDNWHVRAGSLDQWWGPAQSSSLIMSNNTRPIKALSLSRSVNTASKSPYLAWLGPWYFTTQIGQLEENRDVPNAKILLNRFTARPVKGLEVGLSWTAMWGGEGQPSGLSSFIDLITFASLCPADNLDCDDSQRSKLGNHVAGFDIQYTAQLFNRPVSFYLQRVGEDSVDGYKVTDNANLFGVSTYYKNAKIFIETSDTNISCGDDQSLKNCFYENGTYSSGYRMYGRTFGSTFDSDAKQVTIGANLRLEGGSIIEVYLRNADLNPDGQRPAPTLTRDVSEKVTEVSGFYQRPIGNWLVKAGGSISNRRFVNIDNEVDGLVYLKAQLAF